MLHSRVRLGDNELYHQRAYWTEAIVNKRGISLGESRASYRRLNSSQIATAESPENSTLFVVIFAQNDSAYQFGIIVRCWSCYYRLFFILSRKSVNFSHEYKRNLEHLANYTLEICNQRTRGRSMNANHRDIMETILPATYHVRQIFPGWKRCMLLQKLCAHVGNNNRCAAAVAWIWTNFRNRRARARSLAGLTNNSQADR